VVAMPAAGISERRPLGGNSPAADASRRGSIAGRRTFPGLGFYKASKGAIGVADADGADARGEVDVGAARHMDTR
jgi:hypothetical protein